MIIWSKQTHRHHILDSENQWLNLIFHTLQKQLKESLLSLL